MLVPVLTNLRYKIKRKKFNLGKINLKLNSEYNFIYNNAFDENKINYNKNYNNEQNNSKFFKNHISNIIKFITNNFEKNTSICEIGCGKGYFLEKLRVKYKKIIGFDKTFEKNKKYIFNRYVTDKDKIISDLIILRHTLEHIPNPFKFLKMLKKISNNNTYILIEVPDLEWIIKKQTFWDITYEHVNYFSKKTFENLFNKPVKIKKVFNGQYLLILAKLSTLNLKYNHKTNSQNITFNKLFPKINKKINFIEKTNKRKIFFWGATAKTLMFLFYYHKKNKFLNKISFIIDIDIKKQNRYLQVVNKKIISPNKLSKHIRKDDIIIVSNSNYLKEINDFLNTNINFPIKCISLD